MVTRISAGGEVPEAQSEALLRALVRVALRKLPLSPPRWYDPGIPLVCDSPLSLATHGESQLWGCGEHWNSVAGFGVLMFMSQPQRLDKMVFRMT